MADIVVTYEGHGDTPGQEAWNHLTVAGKGHMVLWPDGLFAAYDANGRPMDVRHDVKRVEIAPPGVDWSFSATRPKPTP